MNLNKLLNHISGKHSELYFPSGKCAGKEKSIETFGAEKIDGKGLGIGQTTRILF